MQINEWSNAERPREKLMARGAKILSDAELLAIFLDSGLRGQDVVTTARFLLKKYGPLRALLDRDPVELMNLPGLGSACASRLVAALELCDRHLTAHLERGSVLANPDVAARYFAQRLNHYPYEVFAALFLDTRHRALAFEELFHGTVNRTDVYPREVVRCALMHNAAAIIIGHNHPSGHAQPSDADRIITVQLQNALALVDIRLLDHFVIGDGVPVSFAKNGWL